MSYLLAEPQAMAAVAADIQAIGSTISAASAAAAHPTSTLLAAAGDEVSAAIANLFGAFGQEYQAVASQLAAFHAEFQRTLAAAGFAYATTESTNAAAMGGASAPTSALTWTPNEVSLVIGGTGVPIPSAQFITEANNLYIRTANLLSLHGLYTPEELYPLTGVKSLTLDKSVSEGLTILDNALYDQIHNGGKTVTVFGISQSAVISSLEMRNLAAGVSAFGSSPPDASQLNFVLAGNEMNPNGGMLSRFPNLSIPSLGLTFYGATPADTIYPTRIYTLEYDGFADFPRYPLNLISDLNAVAGIIYVHPTYLSLTPTQIDNATLLTKSAPSATDYYIIPTQNLPLLEPLRAVPVIGNPLANLIQPNLKVIVNLGYGDPNYGYSTSYADVETPFGLFPNVSADSVLNALAAGTQQGIHDFTADLQAMAAQPPTAPSFTPPSPADLAAKVAALPTPTQVVNTVTKIISDDYAVLLPTADIGLSLVTTMPLYDTTLFVDQLAQGNLINAIGYPIAANMGLATIAGAVEFLVLAGAATETIQAIDSLIP